MLTLDQWRRDVNRHLDLIAAGASIVARHCEQLPVRPGFQTYAEDDMMICESALREALVRVQFARAFYAGLRVDA
jgi:hypothetical protein